MRNLKNLVLGRPVILPSLGSMTLDQDDVDLARNWLQNRSQWMDPGLVTQYETRFAHWNGSKHAFAFMGGRVALSACIHALGLQPGDEVILPGYTCVVVPNAFHYAGIKVVYCDIELDTYGLDVAQIKSKITAKTRAILLHHLYGLVCRDYEAIIELAKHHGLRVIEDCAHSTGAEYRGRKVGNWGDAAFYSSEQSKVFTTIQGGIAVTNDEKIAEGLREYYDQAPLPDEDWLDKQLHNVILNYYRFKHPHRWWRGDLINIRYGDKSLVSTTCEEEQGICPGHYGRKMIAPIAAIGINQLKKIDHYNERRRQTAKRWDQWCMARGYKQPVVIDGSVPVYLRYPVLVEPEKKQDPLWAVKELGVNIGVWFVTNIHPAQRVVEGCPNANLAVKQCINFPCLIE
ncbi:MAG: aminotransferase class I/II-fold pyridoxal phosphate-dependent enzyme [bacterium]